MDCLSREMDAIEFPVPQPPMPAERPGLAPPSEAASELALLIIRRAMAERMAGGGQARGLREN
ncbi:MAG TPA: hypothetical protein VGF59_36100 [Bryobacteraceae bacterium]